MSTPSSRSLLPIEIAQALADALDGLPLNGTNPATTIPPWRGLLQVASTSDLGQRHAQVEAAFVQAQFTPIEIEAAWGQIGALKPGGKPLTDWPAPLPLTAFRVYPVFPVGIFPQWMRAYIEGVAEFTQTPPDLAGMLGFAVLALCNQRYAVLQIKPGYEEPLCLYVLVALESGERKSAVYSLMNHPVYEYETNLLQRWGSEIAGRHAERRIIEKRLDKAIADAAGKDGTALDTVLAVELAKELAASAVLADPVLVIQDSTPEAMILELANQGGCLAALDAEGGLLDTLMGARYSDSGTNLDALLKAHAGDEIRSQRVSRGRISIARPMLTMGICPQPEVIAGLADKPGAKKRGLLARFLYSIPASRKGNRLQETPPIAGEVAGEYRQRIISLLEEGEPDEPGQKRVHRSMTLEPEALKLWYTFSAWLEPQLPRDAALGSTNGWAEKLAGEIARIAANLHLADGISPRIQVEIPVTLDAMQRAIYAGKTYLLPHALAALRTMGADPAVEDAHAILRWIQRNGKETFSLRDCCDDLRYRFGRPDDLKPGIAVLEELFYIQTIDEPRGGPGRKPSPRYVVNSKEPTGYTENTGNTPTNRMEG